MSIAIGALATACGGDGGVASAVPVVPADAVDLTGQAAVTVISEDNTFIERSIVVSPGTAITWVNEGRNRHNVTSSVPGRFTDIPTVELDDGGSASRTFGNVGEFAYYCTIHGAINRGHRGWVYVVPAE